MESMMDILVAGNPHAYAALELRRRNLGIRPTENVEVDLNERVAEDQDDRNSDMFDELLR